MADRIDRSLKVLMRQVMPAFLRLVGVEADPAAVRLTVRSRICRPSIALTSVA